MSSIKRLKCKNIKMSSIKRLNIYIILEILKFLYLEIKIENKKKSFNLIFFESVTHNNSKYIAYKPFKLNFFDIFGKWGHYFKKIFFLWKTFEIDIYRDINNIEKLRLILFEDCKTINNLYSNSKTFLFRILYKIDFDFQIEELPKITISNKIPKMSNSFSFNKLTICNF
jgi:hypothetical protein